VAEKPEGCVKPARGPIVAEAPAAAPAATDKEVTMSQARVGHEAPDFETNALVKGGFANVKLSDYRGTWLVLCFYPGDFTFV
jgi:peroxiredoxin (alkyl hydroperoxide reductase subunit C)